MPPAAEERLNTLPSRIGEMVKLSPACVDSATRMPKLPPIPSSALPPGIYKRELDRRNAVLDVWLGLAAACKALATYEAIVTEESLERARKDYPESAELFTFPEFDPVRPDVWLETVYERTDKLALLKQSEDKVRQLEEFAEAALREADMQKRESRRAIEPATGRGAPAQPPLPDSSSASPAASIPSTGNPVQQRERPPGWRLLSIATGPYGTIAYLQDGAGTRWMADRLGKLGDAEIRRITPNQVVIMVGGKTLTFNTTR